MVALTDDAAMYAMLVLYKICILLCGLAFAYMGYRLFLADKTASAGDFSGTAGNYSMSLKGGAPGVFFSLFGTILICFSIFRGITYDGTSKSTSLPDTELVIPETPPKVS